MQDTYKQYLDLLINGPNKGILALDLGQKSVGVAFTEVSVNLPVPVRVIRYKQIEPLLNELEVMIKERKVGLLVVGFNTNQFIMDVIEELKTLDTPIALEDEFYTTKLANQMLSDYGYKRKKRNQVDDMIAASLILESFLEKLLR